MCREDDFGGHRPEKSQGGSEYNNEGCDLNIAKEIMGIRDQLTIVSNRLPVVLKECEGQWQVEPGSGGLVQAMNPILGDNGGHWVGWPGVTEEDGEGWREGLERVSADSGYQLEPVVLSQQEIEGFYEGFANSVVWPLFHGFADRCQFDSDLYDCYGQVNQKFADRVAEKVDDDGFVWVHDYHLFELGRRLRRGGHQGPVAFFLHISFPSVENFAKLPWREEILRDLLHYDLVGFQTERDLHNFERCVDHLGIATGYGEDPSLRRFEMGGHIVEAGAFPIGMDFLDFESRAATDEVSARVEALQSDIGPYKMLLGVDRLDYSKGLIHRLQAYEEALNAHPDLREEVVFFQLVVPSRENVAEYQALKRDFDRVVGRINGRFSTAGWQPIHYLYNRVEPVELSALYRLASVALVTPLRDGMNLVAKEFCASQIDQNGVLVLSEFAGASEQLEGGAILVNPYDTPQTARAIWRAITMPMEERQRRMSAMRSVVASTDVFWWADTFLQRALASRPVEVTQQEIAAAPAGGGVAFRGNQTGQS